jgi:exodeoxyribonuclease VII small subunit
MNKKIDDSLSFEAALLRLEEIVKALESGNAPLDMSLGMFEEGVTLVKHCNDKLDKAEQRIKILVMKQDGSFDEQNFNVAEK